MRIAFLVLDLDDLGGTSRAVVNLANELVARHDVRIISVRRTAEEPHAELHPDLVVDYLIDSRTAAEPRSLTRRLPHARAAELDRRPSVLVPVDWEWQFTALTDVALQDRLPAVEDEVLVTVLPGLLALAAQLLPQAVGLVHQEHRASFTRSGPMAPLLAFAPRADLVAMLGEDGCVWLRRELGSACPEVRVMPNLIPRGYRPRSRLAGDDEGGLIVAAGRLDGEKQFEHTVRAFGQVADELPGWRLRIFGKGVRRNELLALGRRAGLHDRLELPGGSRHMPAEWARADVAVCSSFREGLPLVVQEAMAAGVPVIAYDCPLALRDIVDHEVNGLLVGSDSEPGLAAAMLRLGRDRELRARLGAGATQTALRYDPDSIAAAWEAQFERIVQERRQRLGPLGRFAEGELASEPRPVDEAPPGVLLDDREPIAARREVLRTLAAAAGRSAPDWFVLPAAFPGTPVVVLPMARRRAFLDALVEAGLPAWLSVVDPAEDWWFHRRGTAEEIVTQVRRGATHRLVVEPWPLQDGARTLLAEGAAVEVQFWEEGPSGRWHAHCPNPFVASVAPGDDRPTGTVDGVDVPVLPLAAGSTVTDVEVPVDVVYSWVDGSDPQWMQRRDERLAGTGASYGRSSVGAARFEQHDELRYSLRSLHLFAPWVRTIYLVTDAQRPAWLVEHPRVQVVDHRELLPAEALPTFNSHAIETALHRIPGLAEHFLYFNDDFFLGRPVGPSTFFDQSGAPLVFEARQRIGVPEEDSPAWLHSAARNRELLQERFGRTTLAALVHAPYAHRRSTLEAIEQEFGDVLAETARRPFRDGRDVSLMSSFAQHYGLMTGAARAGEIQGTYLDIKRQLLARRLTFLLRERSFDAFCLADQHDAALQPARIERLLADFMRGYFPLPAPWEAPAEGPA